MAKRQISIPMNIEEVEVLKVEVQGNSLHIQVESSLKDARCEQCGRRITTFHGYGEMGEGATPVELRAKGVYPLSSQAVGVSVLREPSDEATAVELA